MRITWAPGHRLVLFGEYVVWTSLIDVTIYVVLVTIGTNERVQRIWVNPTGALIFFSVIHAWLTMPLSIILALGHLLRRVFAARRLRRGASDGAAGCVAVARWPIWPVVYSSQAVFSAAASDALLLALVNLKPYHNTHWVLYPWGVMAAALFAVWSLRAVCHPLMAGQTAAAERRDLDPLDRLWDWFGEAMLAAAFSSLIVVTGMAWKYIPGDPLSADLLPVNLAILAAGMTPLALMAGRRSIAKGWRHRP